MIRKRHLALGNKGLAVNSIQMLLLQLAPNAGFSKKVYTVVLAVVAVVLMVVAVVLYKCFFLVGENGAFPPTRNGCIHSLSMRERG